MASKTIADRFWNKVAKGDGCWEWQGALFTNGYGKINVGGYPGKRKCYRTSAAHRVSWELHFGVITDGLHVCHRCDNRKCVRPDHLFLGTATDNMRDCAAKGRICTIGPSRKTHCRRGHEYNEANTGMRYGYRRCLACASRRAA